MTLMTQLIAAAAYSVIGLVDEAEATLHILAEEDAEFAEWWNDEDGFYHWGEWEV